MPNQSPSRTVIQSMLRGPNSPATVPDTSSTANVNGVQVTTGAITQSKKNIGDLITHIARADNHLWQALTSIQSQVNDLTGNATAWTSWIPELSNGYDSSPILTDFTSAYYMVNGPLLFIELYTFFTVEVNLIQVSLPISVGEITIKTCAAHLFENSYDFVGIAGVQIINNAAFVYAAPAALGHTCTLMMGGAIAIL